MDKPTAYKLKKSFLSRNNLISKIISFFDNALDSKLYTDYINRALYIEYFR